MEIFQSTLRKLKSMSGDEKFPKEERRFGNSVLRSVRSDSVMLLKIIFSHSEARETKA